MESLGRLAGGVAHDFNNMLGVILGRVELALTHVGPDHTIYKDLTEIQMAAVRSADLTQQLLAFARRQVIAPKVLDLNETVEGILKMLRRLIGECIHLVWKPGSDLWPVKVDATQINQILANLCVNAMDAINGVGQITIQTENMTMGEEYESTFESFIPGDYVRLSVIDNGSGMDDKILRQIFEPFFTTKDIGKGTGLGLATVYGAVKQNGGFIHVASNPDEAISLSRDGSHKIQLLITDVIMPGMNGQDLVKSILAFNPELKYLFMSGYTADVIAHHGVLAPGIHFIEKPFSKKKLCFKVREALDA